MSTLLLLVSRLLVGVSARLYGAEGINIPLRFLPTQTIAPILRSYGAEVGEAVRIRAPLTIHNGALSPMPFYHNLSVGSHVFIGRDCFIDLQDRVQIEMQVTLSHRVMLLTHTDVGESPLKDHLFPPSQAPVILRRGAYVGAGAIILPGVEIGECAVVGAGAVITKSVAAHTVVAGVPARPLRHLEEPSL